MIRAVTILLALLLGTISGGVAYAEEGVRVYAAASLAESINAAADAYAANKHLRPVVVLASSSDLARQIEAGAPGGVFVSADEKWMDHIETRGLVLPGTRARLLTNTLVLVVPVADKRRAKLASGFDLSVFVGDRRWTTGDPVAVPAGIYAKAALTSFGTWDSAARTLVSASNVRAALALVEHGDVGAAIVYGTDAMATRTVAVAGVFPETSHPPIIYPIALTKGAAQEARSFATFLRGERARAIFRAHGFGTLR